MAEENISQFEEKCCLDDAISLEIIEGTMPLIGEEVQEDDVLLPLASPCNEINHVNSRRFLTGTLNKGGPCKPQTQTRYRGNQTSSTHDLCKHGKRREDDPVTKPWKLVVKKKNVQRGEDLEKVETLRKSLVNVSKLEVAKKDARASEIVKSCNGLRVKKSETKTTTTSPLSEPIVVSKVKKTNLDIKKVSRTSESKSPKEDIVKSPKNKEKIDESIKCDEVFEKTLYVVESSVEEKKKEKKKIIKSVKNEIHPSTEKKILIGRRKSSPSLIPSLFPPSEEVKELHATRSDPKPIRKTTTSTFKIGLPEKKETKSTTLVTKPKIETKIKPKRIVLKTTPPTPKPPTKPVSFKKGKVHELKQEDSTPKTIKFKKRVVQEPKVRTDVNKKKILKDKREGVGKMISNNGREKVVLRHRKVEPKKKLQTLFNNVIEETINKFEEVRKSKVKALVGAFETVISLQDDNTQKNKKIQNKSIASQITRS